MTGTVLIVEDEKDLAEILAYNVVKEGFIAQRAGSGAEANAILQSTVPDLILLDIMLPDTTGIEICRRVRQDSRLRHIPVLMLTARSEEIDRVVGFEVGADDYVTKPFSTRELMLRIHALLKRAAAPAVDTPAMISFGNLQIDIPAHRVFVDGRETVLTPLEFNLLKLLHSRRGRVQTREMLLSDVWDITADVTTRTVDTHVKRLREKLGVAEAYIETVRGVGYRFVETPQTGTDK